MDGATIFKQNLGLYILCSLLLFISACSDRVEELSNQSKQNPTLYQVGGTVNGLNGSGLVLQNNQANDLLVDSNSFSFDTIGGIGYDVSVLTHPSNPNQFCSVENGTGNVSFTNRSDIVVDCRNTYIISGTVEGLNGSGLELQNSNGDRISVTGAGFSFPSAVFNQQEYTISVRTQPVGQTCIITEETVLIEGADYNITVNCKTNTYTVAGSITNLSDPSGLTLQINGQQELTITKSSTFAFNQIPHGSNYAVTVTRQPDTQACSIIQPTTKLLDANVSDIDVTCFPTTTLDISAKSRSVFLQWNNTDALGYNLYYSNTENFAPENYASYPNGTLIELAASTSSHTELALTNGVTYYFALEILYANGHKITTIDQSVRPNAWVTNGPVNAVTTDAQGTVYIGGNFTNVGISSGHLIPVNARNGEPRSAKYPIISGSVNAIVSDGTGGWIAGGLFSITGSSISNLVHILADGSLDLNWTPNPDRSVRALAISKGVVYVAGGFTNIGGYNIGKLAIVNLDGSVNQNWAPLSALLSNSSAEINILTIDRNTLYVGGKFTKIDGLNINSLAAYDTISGQFIPTWTPNPRSVTALNQEATIDALAVQDNTLYVAGNFDIIDNQNISKLAALGTTETAGNVITSWTPNPDGAITALHVSKNKLYSAGYFSNIGGRALKSVATFDLAGSTPVLETQWLPALSGTIYSISSDTQTVYLGGNFTLNTEGATRKLIAIVKPTQNETATIAPGWTNPIQPNAAVTSLELVGDTLVVGGKFSAIESYAVNSIAAFDPDGSLYEEWVPIIGARPPGPITSLAILGSTLFIGGRYYAFYNPTVSPGTSLASISTIIEGTTINLNAQLIQTKKLIGDEIVKMTVSINNVFVVGYQGDIETYSENGLLNPNWPSVRVPTGKIEAQVIINGLLFTGGGTHAISVPEPGWSGMTAFGTDGILRTDLTLPYSYEVDSDVTALATNGSMVFAASLPRFGFIIPGTQTTRNLIAFDGNGVIDTNWVSSTSNRVTTLAVYNDSLYVASSKSFNSGSLTIKNTLDGSNTNQGWESNGPIYSIVPTGTKTYIGGNFTSFDGKSRANFAIIDQNGNIL